MLGELLADIAAGRDGFDVFFLHLLRDGGDVADEQLAHGDVGAVAERSVRSAYGKVVGDCTMVSSCAKVEWGGDGILSGTATDRYDRSFSLWRTCTSLPRATMGKRGIQEVSKL